MKEQEIMMKKRIKTIYLDVCALSRPFDEQGYLRIRLETEAVNHKINIWCGNPVTFCEMEDLR
jgi:hypothetical protein